MKPEVLTAKSFEHTNAKPIGETEAGIIFEMHLSPRRILDNVPPVSSEILKYLQNGVADSEKYRRGFAKKMNSNSPNPYPVIGKPSSAFFFRDTSGKYRLHYLVESESFPRTDAPVHHSFLVQYDETSARNCYHPNNLFNRNSLWSGHVANFVGVYMNESYRDALLLDRFQNYQSGIMRQDLEGLQILHANRLLPFTGDGAIIPYPL